MHYFDILTILCVGLMIGNEFAVSVFVNPVVWKLEGHAQAKALSLFASSLGKTMPFWYGLCLLLMLIEAYLRRHEPALVSLLSASAIWIAIVIYTFLRWCPSTTASVCLNLNPTLCPRGGKRNTSAGTRSTVGASYFSQSQWSYCCTRFCSS